MEETENGSRPSCAANTGSKTATVNKVLHYRDLNPTIRFVGKQGSKYLFRHKDDPKNLIVQDFEYFREFCKLLAEQFREMEQAIIDADEMNASLRLGVPKDYAIAAGMANVAR